MIISRRGLIGAGGLLAGSSFLGDHVLAASTDPFIVKIALEEGRVVMAAQIDRNPPELFMLDTGAFANLIKEDVATRYRLKSIGESRTGGIGGSAISQFYDAKNIVVGRAFRQDHMIFGGTKAQLGDRIAGAFSASFMTAFDTDLDFVKGELRIHPGGKGGRAGLIQLDSRIKPQNAGGDKIFAGVSLGAFSVELNVDTGAPGDVVLSGAAS